MRILFIGDIVGESGRRALNSGLPLLFDRFKVNFVIANAENAAGGFGITEEVAKELFSSGIHVLTSGNHIWDKKEALVYIKKETRLLRPANYPPGVPGHGSIVKSISPHDKVSVLNLAGRTFMKPIDCPFRTAEREIAILKKYTNIIIVDFHAEATSEKSALAFFLDGKVSAVIGTHTHVQTADEKILPQGSAFITDTGMTGPINSIIGMKKEKVIQKFLTNLPHRFEVAKGRSILSGVLIDIEPKHGKAKAIQRLQLFF